MLDLLKYLVILIIPLCFVVLSSQFPTLKLHLRPPTRPEQTPAEKDPKKKLKTVMEPPRADLEEPRNEPFTKEQLEEFDGSDDKKPIYVAIKGCSFTINVYFSTDFLSQGTIFDVSKKRDVYGKGKSYNVFAGKDGSKGLGMSSLKPEDAVSDYSVLPENEMRVLNDWYSFFE